MFYRNAVLCNELYLDTAVFNVVVKTVQQEAQLSQRDRAAACLNYGKNISAKSVHLGYFFKVQWQQCRAAHSLGSLIMSMPASVT